MKLKYNFISNNVADKIVAVAVGDSLEKFNGFLKLNDTGAFIFNMLKNDVTEDEIVDAVIKEYDVKEDVARISVQEFIKKLKDSDVLE